MMTNCSHVGLLQEHDPLIIFLKGAIYNVFNTILPSFFLLIVTFIQENSDILKPCDCWEGSKAWSPEFFLCDKNLVSFGDVLLRFCLKNDKNDDNL